MRVEYDRVTSAIAERLENNPHTPSYYGQQDGAIIDASDLIKPLPRAPFIAMRRGQPYGTTIPYKLYIYDDPEYGHRRIDQLLPLIMAAFPTPEHPADPIIIPGHAIGSIAFQPGAQATDTTLGQRPYCLLTLLINVAARRT